MIKKEDLVPGMLVKRIYSEGTNGKMLFSIKTVEKINDKSFRCKGDFYNIKYDESHAYSEVTGDEYDLFYENALKNTCIKNLKEVKEVNGQLKHIYHTIEELVELKRGTGVEWSINIDSLLGKIDKLTDRLDAALEDEEVKRIFAC